jgi:hypothetical protein
MTEAHVFISNYLRSQKVTWYCSGVCLERDKGRHMGSGCPYEAVMDLAVEHQNRLLDSGSVVSLSDLEQPNIGQIDFEAIVEFEKKHPEIYKKPEVIPHAPPRGHRKSDVRVQLDFEQF